MYKNSLILFSLILVLSLLLSSCGGGQPKINTDPAITPAPPRGTTGTISTGKTVAAASVKVPSSGGTLTVSEPGTPITGLELTIPANAYTDIKTFEISYAPIEKHSFGQDFNPLTPLIKVDNGGDYSAETMTLKIPVKVPEGSFAMGFIYDSKTKKLNGLPTIASDADSITIATSHFSDVIISCISDALIKKDVDSGFRPGIDDWQFINRGSFIAQGGHCAGQSVTALWYYVTQPDGKDLTLNGRYDNNGNKPSSPSFDYDDNLAYRFVSAVHSDINWDSYANRFWKKMAGANDELTWKLFAYSMQITGEPQETGIYSKAGGGHDMICYRVKDGNLYIADPNYPGNNERRIEYSNGKFKPYNSGANFDEIAKGNGKAYETIQYCAKTDTLSWDKIAQRWEEMKDKTVGDNKFPAYQIIYKDENGKYPELLDGFTFSNKLIRIAASSTTPNIGCYIFRDGALLKFDAQYNVELVPGVNNLGIFIVCTVDAKDKDGNPIKIEKYVDFKYLTVTFKSEDAKISIDPPTLDGQEKQLYTFNLVNPENIKYVRLDWLLDGVIAYPASAPKLEMGFPAGDHTITVNLYDLSQKLLGTAESSVHINAVVVSNLLKLQQLKSISGAFFGKNTYSLSTGGEMVNGSSIGAPSIPITWSGTSFSGKMTVEDNNSPSTDEIQGTVSVDGNTLQSLKFTHSDYNYGGYGKSSPNYTMYTKSMQLQNVPLSQYEIGKGLVSGPATQACVIKLEYNETTFKNGVKSYEKTYVSTDWAASGIGATPQIGIYFGK